MADPDNIIIKHADHLLLEQQLIRLPYEQLRKNFRGAHIAIEKESATIKSAAQDAATSIMRQTADRDATLGSLDSMIQQVEALKKKLEGYAEEEERLISSLDARLTHVGNLYSFKTYQDSGYEAWSRVRLDRLMSDYLLQQGFSDSAKELAKERGIEALVDIEPFETWNKIRTSLENHVVTEALAWCAENKKELRKMNCNLEFMLRYQQYIEMLRPGDPSLFVKAIHHARKYIVPFQKQYPAKVFAACGLIAYRSEPDGDGMYSCETWSPSRWKELSDLFTDAFHALYGIHSRPLLHVALSAGISALKTPRCHVHDGERAAISSPKEERSVPTVLAHNKAKIGVTLPSYRTSDYIDSYDARETMCPICSSELNELARTVPYANHTRSCVDHDMVVLPNGHAFSKSKLLEYAKKTTMDPNTIRDLRSGQLYKTSQMKKIYIT
ncbi:Protein FYV10 [Ceratocystis lukuohia]|uniref:Protein FYV10 n=1 Tax=Ceratocystis lukuohia TaxID=2019550 RepID=A0ABR4MNM8_9PEZI